MTKNIEYLVNCMSEKLRVQNAFNKKYMKNMNKFMSIKYILYEECTIFRS